MAVSTSVRSNNHASLLHRNWFTTWWETRSATAARVSLADYLRYRVVRYQRQLLSHGFRLSIEVTLERGALTLVDLPPVSMIGENAAENDRDTAEQLAWSREELRVALETDRFAFLNATSNEGRTPSARRRALLSSELMPSMEKALRRESHASASASWHAVDPRSYSIVDNEIVPPSSIPSPSNMRCLHAPTRRRPPVPPLSPR